VFRVLLPQPAAAVVAAAAARRTAAAAAARRAAVDAAAAAVAAAARVAAVAASTRRAARVAAAVAAATPNAMRLLGDVTRLRRLLRYERSLLGQRRAAVRLSHLARDGPRLQLRRRRPGLVPDARGAPF